MNLYQIALDADEAYSMAVSRELRECLLNKLSQKHYETSKNDNVPLVINIPVVNLIKDQIHSDDSGVYHSQKIFYYREGLSWRFDQYFCHITYDKEAPMEFGKGGDTVVYSIIGSHSWLIKHYTRLNPERLKWRAEHTNDPKFGNYETKAWEKKTPKILLLDESKW